MPKSGRIWLIGGTSESAKIAQLLTARYLPCTVTVTTEAAQDLYPQRESLRVGVGRIDFTQVSDFLREEQIIAVVDASHPYAVEVSQGAIAAATASRIPYLRYERPAIDQSEGIVALDFDTLLRGDYLLSKRVLLTIGYKALPLFQPWQDRSTLFARILPTQKSLEVAAAAGFKGDRLIALRPPVSAALETALWQQWQISLVVTKASGQAGGEDVKRRVAAELGIPLIVIARPRVIYPQQTSDLGEVLAFCLTVYSGEDIHN